MDTDKALYDAKRTFDKSKDAVNDETRVIFGENRDRWQKHALLNELYYAMPAFSQTAGYVKRAEKLFAAEPELAARLRPLVQGVVDAGTAVAAAKQAHDEFKAQRQAERDAKKAYRGDMNLVKAMALPRAEYRERAVEFINEWVVTVSNNLAKANWDLNAAYPFPGREDHGFKAAQMSENRRLADKFFTYEGRYSSVGFLKAVRREDIQKIVSDMADKMTEQYFDGYIIKLSGKIGKPVKHAKLEGSLWSNSTLRVNCEDGEQQVWHTKCIFNRSVLGKVFNQWPTRRVE